MLAELSGPGPAVGGAVLAWVQAGWMFLQVLIGFSLVIFVHELGHFLAAKWMGVRVDRFAVGFFRRVCGYRRGEGFTFGPRPDYPAAELAARGWGETDYCLNILPFGGYVKMMGQDDIDINEQTGEVRTTDDPRAFPNKPVGRRMVIVSAGVVFNLLFAVVVYAAVLLVAGREVVAPVVGLVDPGEAAAAAGLWPGDRVLAINGRAVESFEDLGLAVLLADGPLRLRVARDGRELAEELVLEPRVRPDGQRAIGIEPMLTTTLGAAAPGAALGDGPRPGDRITHVGGRPVANLYALMEAFALCGGRDVTLTVERPERGAPGGVRTLTLTQRPILALDAANPAAGSELERVDSQHLLGFRQRRMVESVEPGQPAERAGFRPGDVIAQWGNVANPLWSDIVRGIESHSGRPLRVVVERDGQPVELEVTPRRPLRLFGRAAPRVGLAFVPESARAVVADVVPGTPAAALGLPRGAEIVALDGEPVAGWIDVFERLRAAAGRAVAVRYRTAGDEAVGQLQVPSSIVNELDLPPTAVVVSVDGARSVTLESGRKLSVDSWEGLRRLLETQVGRTVEVAYVASVLDPRIQVRPFTVRPDNVDPWPMRVHYRPALGARPLQLTERISAGGNPVRALALGLAETGDVLRSVYRVIVGMLRSAVSAERGAVSPKELTGPIGIFQHAIRYAELGFGDLLFFLAFISVNLAVINFLPLPVVDGGLMVFLILEKIRRKPLSLRVQVTTTLVGLALIVCVFLFVTIQDIGRWFGGS